MRPPNHSPSAAIAATAATGALLFYDGTCPLCHGAVLWLLHHDRHHRLRFAPLQGETARALRLRLGLGLGQKKLPNDLQAVAAYVDGQIWLGAPAIFAVLAELPQPWRWGAHLRHLPAPLSAGVYRLVAALRFRVFGRYPSCRLPQANERERLLP